MSYTFLLGDKHVPEGKFGQQAVGDGSIYDGHPQNSARVAGVGFGLPIQALPSTSISAAITTGSSSSWLPTAASPHLYRGHERGSAGTVSLCVVISSAKR